MKPQLLKLSNRIPFRRLSLINGPKSQQSELLNSELNIRAITTTMYKNGRPGKSMSMFGLNETNATAYNTLADLLEARPDVAEKAAGLYPKKANGKA